MANDTELESLFSITESLKSYYIRDENLDPWVESPFAWIKTRPSRQVGKIGEQIIAEWCKQKRFIVSKSRDSDADLVLNGHHIEIKFSTLWESGVFTFQQLRDQNYEYAFLLGSSLFAAHGWLVLKKCSSPICYRTLHLNMLWKRVRYILVIFPPELSSQLAHTFWWHNVSSLPSHATRDRNKIN